MRDLGDTVAVACIFVLQRGLWVVLLFLLWGTTWTLNARQEMGINTGTKDAGLLLGLLVGDFDETVVVVVLASFGGASRLTQSGFIFVSTLF